MTNIVLFGKPGAGKGTQADFLKIKYNLYHISTGDLFRFNISNKTSLGNLAKTYMDNGDLVPDEVTIEMLKECVESNFKSEGFIFDGFPRTISQAKVLDEFLGEKSVSISAMISLEVDEEILIKRLIDRGKISGRTDDMNESKIRNRFREYNMKTSILQDYYKKQNKFYGISGVGTIEEINSRLTRLIDSFLL
ncbi:MAG: adenylate kinase [Flavobacteriaceae bacterium]|jgi:adenylate kinase|nr:adenylate kinase [Flavobacteriaceae bacterium]|tara:strand:- start:1114 stop:1692 length:579 start_codon:yes stop_codon:yes gene_type:complete